MEPGCTSTTPDGSQSESQIAVRFAGAAAPVIPLDLEWVNQRKSLSRPGVVYSSARGTPTTFHLRHTCVLLARPLGTAGAETTDAEWVLAFFARPESFVMRALGAVYDTFSTRRYDLNSGVFAIFEEHAKVFDANGVERSGVKASDLEGWAVHALITLRGKWESGHHTGLRLEVAQVQLVQPLWDCAVSHGED
jgi:hypothetical protein